MAHHTLGVVQQLLDYEQSLIFLRVGEQVTRAKKVIFARVHVLSHSTIPEKKEGMLVV